MQCPELGRGRVEDQIFMEQRIEVYVERRERICTLFTHTAKGEVLTSTWTEGWKQAVQPRSNAHSLPINTVGGQKKRVFSKRP